MKKNNDFQFKQFNIRQQNAGMKVGTDGILLGAWTPVDRVQSILDIGTGTGLIALMMAQRSSAVVFGVELERAACQDACFNVEASPWSHRIQVFNRSIQEFTRDNFENFDLIVSNPPYFVNSKKSNCEKRTVARHADTLSYVELIRCSEKLLSADGRFCIVFPRDQLENILFEANSVGLWEQRITLIYTKANKAARRVLLMLARNRKTCIYDHLVIHAEHSNEYTGEYINLTSDFYLMF